MALINLIRGETKHMVKVEITFKVNKALTGLEREVLESQIMDEFGIEQVKIEQTEVVE